jgi:hypothetical protein
LLFDYDVQMLLMQNEFSPYFFISDAKALQEKLAKKAASAQGGNASNMNKLK